jgi:hypothetical protein
LNFILRIFFSGLIAFVPNEESGEVTVLLLDSGHSQHASATPIPEHRAHLLARAGGCLGDCTTSDIEAATFLYPDISDSAADDSLALAVEGGTVWRLNRSQLSFGMPDCGVTLMKAAGARGKATPENDAERADFGWVPNLKEIDPSLGSIQPVMLGPMPPQLIAGRIVLQGGTLSTHSVVEVGGKALPMDFRPLEGTGEATYQRAAATWVQAEIRMPGNSMTILEKNLDTGLERKVTLQPKDGVIELAVLNIQKPTRRRLEGPPAPGLHFERYWELAEHPPLAAARAIPQMPRIATTGVAAARLQPKKTPASDLLSQLLFADGRGPFDQVLCPMSQYPRP